MNPLDHFKTLLRREKDPVKRALHKDIIDKSWNITGKMLKGDLKEEDVKALEITVDEFYTKYPNPDGETTSRNNIAKFRKFI